MRKELRSRRGWSAWVVAGLTVGMLGYPATELAAEDDTARELATELKGVVIEQVDEGSAIAAAGLQLGDGVFAWERLPNPPANSEADRGEIETVFDWMWLEVEQAPRGTVKLFGERQGVERIFEVAMGKWAGKVRPRLPRRLHEVYTKGQEQIEVGEIEQGVELWSQLTKPGEVTSDRQMRSWIQLRIAEAWEIFESVLFDADLVVLSACESGLGEEIDGEGLWGLTRAFQYAGARTVASSPDPGRPVDRALTPRLGQEDQRGLASRDDGLGT